MLVDELLSRTAARLPGKTALICDRRRVTYAEIDRESDRVAALLEANGVQRGDRVAIYLDNSVEAVIAIFATLKAAAVFVVVNPTVKESKLEFMLTNCRATALFCDGRRLSMFRGLWNATPHLRTVVTVGAEGRSLGAKTVLGFSSTAGSRLDRLVREQRAIDIDLAGLIYTSGSTGRPKGVMLTHLNIVSAATSVTSYLRSTETDVILNVLPLAFTYGLYQVLTAFRVGATVVLERSFAYPHAVLDAVGRERVSGFPIVPTIAAIMPQLDLSRYDFTSLRYITNAAAALPVPHIVKLRRLLPHVQLYSMYGLTECARASCTASGFLDSGLTVFASTPPRPTRGGRVAPGPGLR